MAASIDIGTLYFSAAVVAVFFGFAFIAFHFTEFGVPGIFSWGMGYLAIAAALILSLLRGEVPILIYGPLAGMLAVTSSILVDHGTRPESARREAVIYLVVPLVAIALQLVFAYVVPTFNVRLAVVAAATGGVTARTSVRLWNNTRESGDGLRLSYTVFAVCYSILSLSLIAIAVITLVARPIQDLTVSSPGNIVLLSALMLFFIGAGMSKLWVHYMSAYGEAKRAATVDPLTGVRNRRYVMPELERLFRRSQRENRELACLMIDADSFKSVNDEYGHRKGDAVLQMLAARITACVREYDLVGRYGGEEFLVVVPELNRDDVIRMAERLHQSIRSAELDGVRITASVGVAFLSQMDGTADDLIQRADRALYRAKRSGRDRVAVDGLHADLEESVSW